MKQEQQFIKGFNNGYLLAKHEPELLKQLLTINKNNNDYIKGVAFGKKEHDIQKMKNRLNSVSKNQSEQRKSLQKKDRLSKPIIKNRTFNTPVNVAFEATKNALVNMHYEIITIDSENGNIEAKKSGSIFSYGNIMSIQRHCKADTEISASSNSFALQIFDWGKNEQ